MKQAILITAYKDFKSLITLLRYYDDFFSCYVHIDKKSEVPQYFFEEIQKLHNVRIIQKYKVNWGSYKHISSVIKLIKMAKNDGCEYFHILSANTFPVKPVKLIKDYFDFNVNMNYIEVIPELSEESKQRQKYFYFESIYDLKTKKGVRIAERIINIQRKLRINRKIRLKYKGYFYCHLTLDFIDYLLHYLKRNQLYFCLLKTYSCPEEFFFQNIIMNSSFSNLTVNNSLIFDIWENGNSNPNTLTANEIDKAILSDKLFARKIEDIHEAEYCILKLNTFEL